MYLNVCSSGQIVASNWKPNQTISFQTQYLQLVTDLKTTAVIFNAIKRHVPYLLVVAIVTSSILANSTDHVLFFDVRVFNPHAPSNRHTQLSSCYRKHEQIKKRAYEQRIREVEHASFTPLVISATGGLANEASTFYKRLTSLLASKWDHPYSSTLCWLHSSRAFSILRSAIQSTRGVQSSSGHAIRIPTMVDLINVESNISPAV